MRKFLLFLSLIVAMVCKAQTKQELLPVGTMAPDFDTDKAKMNGYLSANQYSWLQYSEFKKWKETQISKDYHISWIPTSYLIDPEGKIAFSTLNAEEMLEKLDSLKAEL